MTVKKCGRTETLSFALERAVRTKQNWAMFQNMDGRWICGTYRQIKSLYPAAMALPEFRLITPDAHIWKLS